MSSVHEYLETFDTRPLMPGAKPFLLEAGEVGCLLLHGWGGTCDSMRYLGGRLHQAGITAFAPLLPGHGIDATHLAQTRAADWVYAAEDHLHALHELCPTLFVAGLSMGAILTLYLGERYPSKLRGIVPINGGVAIGSPAFAAMAFRRDLPDIIPSWDEEILLKDKSVTEVAFRQMARTTILDVLGLAKAVEEMLSLLRTPILILQSFDDQVLPSWNAQYVAERIPSEDREIVVLENSYHVATMDYDKDLVADHVIRFVQGHS